MEDDMDGFAGSLFLADEHLKKGNKFSYLKIIVGLPECPERTERIRQLLLTSVGKETRETLSYLIDDAKATKEILEELLPLCISRGYLSVSKKVAQKLGGNLSIPELQIIFNRKIGINRMWDAKEVIAFFPQSPEKDAAAHELFKRCLYSDEWQLAILAADSFVTPEEHIAARRTVLREFWQRKTSYSMAVETTSAISPRNLEFIDTIPDSSLAGEKLIKIFERYDWRKDGWPSQNDTWSREVIAEIIPLIPDKASELKLWKAFLLWASAHSDAGDVLMALDNLAHTIDDGEKITALKKILNQAQHNYNLRLKIVQRFPDCPEKIGLLKLLYAYCREEAEHPNCPYSGDNYYYSQRFSEEASEIIALMDAVSRRLPPEAEPALFPDSTKKSYGWSDLLRFWKNWILKNVFRYRDLP